MPELIYIGGDEPAASKPSGISESAMLERVRTLTVDAEVRKQFRVSMPRTRSLSAVGSLISESANEVTMPRTRTLSAVGRINSDANVFGSVTMARTRAVGVTTARKVRGKVRLMRERSLSVESTHVVTPSVHYLHFVFDTLAPDADASAAFGGENGYVGDMPRLTAGPEGSNPADWIELKIAEWSYTESPDTVSSSVEFLLADPNDLARFNTTMRYEFSVAQKIAGAWDESSVHRLIPNGEFRGSRHVVSWENGAPGDNVRVRIESGHDAKLATTAETDLIIYDPNRDEVDEAALEPVYDTLGNAYAAEVVQRYGLTLHALFDAVLVDRCGLAGVFTNIPDYPTKRYDCAMGASLYEALKQFLGMFDPVIYPDGNNIWIVDTTVSVPEGFPAARSIRTDRYRVYSDNIETEKLDGLLVQFLEEESDYDFTTTRNDEPSVEQLSDGTTVTTERRYLEYRKFDMPFVVVREALDKETRTTEMGGQTVNVTVDDLSYTRGLVSKRVKTVTEWLPDVFLSSASSTVYSMQETERETETYSYKRHPFKPRQQYLAKKTFSRTGIILNDSANRQFGEDFESLLRVAYRSGNLYEGMTTRSGPVYSRREVSTPLRNGQVRTHVIEVDEIKGLVVVDYTEERAGDVGLGYTEGQQRRLVFESEDAPAVRETDKRIETMHIGEVPITLGIPLARRKLKARRTAGNGTLQLDAIGIDRNWKRGSTVALYGRAADAPSTDDEFLGNFITLGRSYTGGFGRPIHATYTLRKI